MSAATDVRRRFPFRWPAGIGALALAGSLALAGPARAQDVGLPIGTTPVAAQVEDLDGNAVDLQQFLGKRPVLLEFWATWCPLCRALEPQLSAAKKQFGDNLEILFIGVGVNQTPRQIKRHLETHTLPGKVFFDAKGAAVRAYDAPATSYIVILDAERQGGVHGFGRPAEARGSGGEAAGALTVPFAVLGLGLGLGTAIYGLNCVARAGARARAWNGDLRIGLRCRAGGLGWLPGNGDNGLALTFSGWLGERTAFSF